ncbi:MAG: sulfite exporter TauE/SafE family protein [Acetivibrionales bacterium]|jgi:uncharacterized membrane protein YfcA
MEYLFSALTVIIASFIQTVAGFGMGIFIMAVIPLLLPHNVAILISVSISFITTLLIVIKIHHKTDYKAVWVPFIFATAGTIISLLFVKNTSMIIYKRMLGVFLFLLSIWFTFISEKVKIKPSTKNGVVAGTLSGVFNGLFTLNGPPMVLYYLAAIDDTDVYRSTSQYYFFLINTVSVISRAATGTLHLEHWKHLLAGALVIPIGVFIGLKLVDKINKQTIKKIIYIFLAMSGLYIAITG